MVSDSTRTVNGCQGDVSLDTLVGGQVIRPPDTR
jgi:hypothetical protein